MASSEFKLLSDETGHLTSPSRPDISEGAPMPGIDYSTLHTKGNGKADGQFPVFHARPPDAQDRPITKGDAWRAMGTLKAEIAGGIVVLWVCYRIFLALLDGGWLNTPVNNTVLQAVTSQQANENSFFHNKLDTIDSTLVTHSVALGNLNGLMLKQAEIASRIEGKLEGILARIPSDVSRQIAAPAQPAPLPAAANPSPKKSKPKPKPATTGVAGWFAKIGG